MINKETTDLKTIFNFFVFCLLQKLCLLILTTNLQEISIWLILFNDFMKKDRSFDEIYAIKTNNCVFDIIGVQDFGGFF